MVQWDLRLVFGFVFLAVILVLFSPDTPISGKELRLGDPAYDMKVIDAPAVSGVLLQLAAQLIGSRFGPALKRLLMANNKIHHIRELASQVALPPLYFPIHRISSTERRFHEQAARTDSTERLLEFRLDFEANRSRLRWTTEDYARAYRSQEISPTATMTAAIAHVRKLEQNGQRIFSSFLADDVLKQAAESDRRFAEGRPISILDGVPVAFKDCIAAKGHTIYNGRDPADPLNRQFCEGDDVIVERFRKLGAIVFGMTVMTEGGVTPLGFNSHFHGPTSPFDRNRYSGGSSAGSGVAVATGLVPIAVGFDSGGSIRLPSASCGVHGLAVTFGRIPFYGDDSTLNKAGPLAASAGDVALAYAVMSPNLPGHFYNQRYDGDNQGPPPPNLKGLLETEDLSDVRIGVFREWFEDAEPAVLSLCRAAVRCLESRGATVVDVAIPHLQELSLSHGLTVASEYASKFDLHYHTRRESLEPGTQITLGIGAAVTSQEFIGAAKLRAWISRYLQELFQRERLTVLATPAMSILPPVLEESAKSVGESNTVLMVKMMKYVFLANFVGLPAYSVPVGFAESTNKSGQSLHLPVGLQLVGSHWSEAQLLRLARSIELHHTDKLHSYSVQFPFKPLQT